MKSQDKKEIWQKDLKDKVVNFIDETSFFFELQNFSRSIYFNKEDCKDNDNTLADITTDTSYKVITINLYPKFIDFDKEQQCKTLIHELAHTLTVKLKEVAYEFINGRYVTEKEITHRDEYTVETISNMLFNLSQDKNKYFKEAINRFLR